MKEFIWSITKDDEGYVVYECTDTAFGVFGIDEDGNIEAQGIHGLVAIEGIPENIEYESGEYYAYINERAYKWEQDNLKELATINGYVKLESDECIVKIDDIRNVLSDRFYDTCVGTDSADRLESIVNK